nr:hypothetical protein [Pandoravirus aubagnensis]
MNDDGTSTVYMQNTHKRGREHDVRAAGTTPNTSTVANENRDQAHLRSEPSSLLCKEGRSRKRLRVTDCPWTDAVQAPTVWALVVDYMLAKVYALDRSSFGGGADKGHLHAARTLLRIGSTCRALYTCVGGLCMRLDALVGIEDDTDEKSLLWCAVARTDVTPHEATFDTNHTVYRSLLHIERLVMRSGHLCARDLDRPFGCTVDLSAPAEDDAVRPMLIVAKAKSCKDDIDDVDDDQKENDKERNDKDADKEECESDDDEDDDEDQDSSDEDSDDDDDDESRPFKSMIDIPSYQDLWDQVKWPRAKDLHSGDENDNGSEDEEFEDYGDTHEEEEGTLSQQDSKGRNWTLTIYSHYHHGLTLVDVQIVP